MAWLERFLKDFPGTVVAVTHDRYFLDNVAGWILELDRGAGIPWKGNYSSWLEQKGKRLAQEEKQESARQRTLERELEWVACRRRRARPRARRACTRYEELLAQEQREARTTTSRSRSRPARASATSSSTPSSCARATATTLLIDDLDFRLPRGGIVGVIGPNGAGKTTLFRMIIGQEKPDGGTLRVGETVKLAYVDQSRDALDRRQDRLGGDLRRRRVSSSSASADHVARLRVVVQLQGLRPAEARSRSLSGGERNRVHLAKLLKTRRQPAAARRADQRSRRRHAARARGGALELRRLRRRHQPRSLVPRSHRHAHPRLRGRQPRSSGSRATTRTTKRTSKRRLGADADQPHRIRYKKLTH